MPTREEIASAYQRIQDEICAGLELADGKGIFEEELGHVKVEVEGVPVYFKTELYWKKEVSIFRPFMVNYPKL